MQPISSSAPDALRAYSLAADSSSARLDAEARRLEAALAELHARCTEYPLQGARGLDRRLHELAQTQDELAAWVAGIATAFREADSGAVGANGADRLTAFHRATGSAPAPKAEHDAVGLPPLRPYSARPPHQAAAFRMFEASVTLLHRHPDRALEALSALVPAEIWKQAWEAKLFLVTEVSDAAEQGRGFEALDRALSQVLPLFADVAQEQSPDLARFSFASVWAFGGPFVGKSMVQDGPIKSLQFNLIGLWLLSLLEIVERRSEFGLLPTLLAPSFDLTIGASAIGAGVILVGMGLVADAPHWAFQPVDSADDVVALTQRSIWQQVLPNVTPALRLELARRIDALNLQLNSGYQGQPVPPAPPANTLHGAYAAISYGNGEQLVLEQLNADGDYRISITGLNPLAAGAPNNFTAVMLAADYEPADNHYYTYVRQRLLSALEQIPPGSKLHLQGHSLGGAMCLMLWEDPEIQRRLKEADVIVSSLTIYGAVIPNQVQIPPPQLAGSPFAGLEFRAFVHNSDSLALNVGAGYEGFTAVQMIGDQQVLAPDHAHGDYANPEHYADIPPELQALPYVIDPEAYERMIPGQPQPPGQFVPVEGFPALAA